MFLLTNRVGGKVRRCDRVVMPRGVGVRPEGYPPRHPIWGFLKDFVPQRKQHILDTRFDPRHPEKIPPRKYRS